MRELHLSGIDRSAVSCYVQCARQQLHNLKTFWCLERCNLVEKKKKASNITFLLNTFNKNMIWFVLYWPLHVPCQQHVLSLRQCSRKNASHWSLRMISGFVLCLSKNFSVGFNGNVGHFDKKKISFVPQTFSWTLIGSTVLGNYM